LPSNKLRGANLLLIRPREKAREARVRITAGRSG
jgi:hypothetical protein